ncbi:hypothetical protein BDZ89DRAFT_966006 [Hymenopellis radicata]|nr:hypothetical protein BDZ89DRAFT_966006 [Hymenopellis radicata]
MHPLRHITVRYNDLGHPLCGPLRDGPWALAYVHARLQQVRIFASRSPNPTKVAQWLKQRFDKVAETVPPFLRPKYFALIICTAYKAARRAVVVETPYLPALGRFFE